MLLKSLPAAAALTLLAGLIACEQQPSSPTTQAAGGGNSSDTILVGHYGSMTGAQATFGQSTSRGIRLAIDEVNAAGGINGKKVVLREYDTKGDAKEATNAVMRLVDRDQVTAVLGEVASSLSLAGGPVCQNAGVPMISPSSTNPRVTQIGDMIFRVCFIDPFQAFVGAKFATENLKATKSGLLYDQKSAYSVGLAQEFKKHFTKMGGQITSEQTYSEGDQDFSAQLTSIRSTNPDIIYIPGYYTDVGNIALQARNLGIEIPMMGGDGWDSEQLITIAGKAVEGCYFSNHYAPDQPEARIREFIAKYQKAYDGATPDGLAALAYDAAHLLCDAMKRAKSLGGSDLRAAIAATRNFQGVTGEITIDPDRNAKKPAVIVKLTGDPPAHKYQATITPD